MPVEQAIQQTLEMDWLHSQQALTWNPERKGKEDDREAWKQTSKKLDTARDSWRDYLRTIVLGGVMLMAGAPGGVTKVLID